MINSDKKPFTAVAVKDDGLGGTSLPKPQTPTYQQPKPKQQTTNQTTGQTTNRITKGTDQKKPDTYETTAVTADDFLRGFNEGYEEEPSTPTYSPQQTTNQTSKPLPGNSVRKNQNNRGISAVTADDFIRGFNEDYEENEPAVPEPRNPSLVDLTVNSFDKGYNNAARGQEVWKSMYGQENDLDKYNELLSSDKYNFETDDWWEKMISGASGHLGQWVRQLTDPETVAMSLGAGGTALLAGQTGPQALLPEEILTVPVAFTAAMKAGNAKTNMEIEGGNAYLEMLDNGVSEETARAIATGVGGVNAMLETLQLDELLKAYTILDKAEADDTLLNLLVREVTKRSLDTSVETVQEDLQELATIAGVQLGSKIDTGEWVYSFADMVRRVWDTTKESVLTFGLTNLPSIVNNVIQQSQYRSAANGQGRYTADDALRNHIENGESTTSRRRGVKGAHVKDAFMQNDILIVSSTPHPQIPGVEIITYRMPKRDKTGTPISGEYQSGNPQKKTIYDPDVFSTDEYIRRGMEAANNAAKMFPDGVLPREWSGYDNQGVEWHGYYHDGHITSFYPD